MNGVIIDIFKGLLLSLLYFEITKANDTTPYNIFLFVIFYVTMIYGSKLTGVDPKIVTNAFITKTIFTLIDERVRKKEDNDKK